jgi:hypothetical protein
MIPAQSIVKAYQNCSESKKTNSHQLDVMAGILTQNKPAKNKSFSELLKQNLKKND